MWIGMRIELMKRPRPRPLHPDLVSSPQPTPPRGTRPRKQGAEKGPRRAAAEKRPTLNKSARCGSRAAGAGLRPCRFEQDIWTEVAKHLQAPDLLSLSATCSWFCRLLSDDSIWRYAFLRELSLHTDDPKMLRVLRVARPFHRSWRLLYATALDPKISYCFRQPDNQIESFRLGGFLVDTSKLVLTAKLALPPWLMQMLDDNGPDTSIGACLLTNVRPGIWIADMHKVQCPDDDDGCQGTVQVLDARHCELYLENKFRDGTWEYEDLGSHLSGGQVDTAAAAIFNRHHFDTPCVKNILSAESWIRGRSNLLPRAYLTPVGVALSTNLMPKCDLLSRFQAMRDTTGDGHGQIVSVRITQHLLL